MGAAGPGLFPTHQVVVVTTLRARADLCQIGASTGLRISLTPDAPSLTDGRQMLRLLLRSSPPIEHRREHVGAKSRHLRGLGSGGLAVPDELFSDTPAAAPKLYRPLWYRPATLYQGIKPVLLGRIVGAAVGRGDPS